MKTVLLLLGLFVGGLVVVGLLATLLIVAASGLAWLVTRFLPLETGQATLIALIAIIAALTAGWRIVVAFIHAPSMRPLPDDGADELDDDEWDDEAADEDKADDYLPSIPRWRQPIKRTRFEGVGRNDPCPCGSGRKYKNCHGRR